MAIIVLLLLSVAVTWYKMLHQQKFIQKLLSQMLVATILIILILIHSNTYVWNKWSKSKDSKGNLCWNLGWRIQIILCIAAKMYHGKRVSMFIMLISFRYCSDVFFATFVISNPNLINMELLWYNSRCIFQTFASKQSKMSFFFCTGEKLLKLFGMLKLLLSANLLFINFFLFHSFWFPWFYFFLFHRDGIVCFRRQKQGNFFESIKYY